MFKKLLGAEWLRSSTPPLGAALGHLERDVMDVVWKAGEAPVREVQAALSRTVAYTTVMTTLDRLFKKGLVDRRRVGRAFVYKAALSRNEMEARMTTGLLTGMLSTGSASARPFLSNLVDAVADRDNGLLDELEHLVREKRERIRRGER
jgi:predicted transcriptional regulator